MGRARKLLRRFSPEKEVEVEFSFRYNFAPTNSEDKVMVTKCKSAMRLAPALVSRLLLGPLPLVAGLMHTRPPGTSDPQAAVNSDV